MYLITLDSVYFQITETNNFFIKCVVFVVFFKNNRPKNYIVNNLAIDGYT